MIKLIWYEIKNQKKLLLIYMILFTLLFTVFIEVVSISISMPKTFSDYLDDITKDVIYEIEMTWLKKENFKLLPDDIINNVIVEPESKKEIGNIYIGDIKIDDFGIECIEENIIYVSDSYEQELSENDKVIVKIGDVYKCNCIIKRTENSDYEFKVSLNILTEYLRSIGETDYCKAYYIAENYEECRRIYDIFNDTGVMVYSYAYNEIEPFKNNILHMRVIFLSIDVVILISISIVIYSAIKSLLYKREKFIGLLISNGMTSGKICFIYQRIMNIITLFSTIIAVYFGKYYIKYISSITCELFSMDENSIRYEPISAGICMCITFFIVFIIICKQKSVINKISPIKCLKIKD